MLKSCLTIAFKHFVTQKLYSALNIAGLTIGLTCFMLIALFVRHELSFDKHFSNVNRTYRISMDFFPPGAPAVHVAGTPPAMASRLKLDFPQIDEVARLSACGDQALVAKQDRAFQEAGLAGADNALFAIFDFEWLQGSPANALLEPRSIVLTESAARKYFGAESPMGQTLFIENEPVEVTGVIRDLPDNTHLSFTMLVSMQYFAAVNGEGFLDVWNMNCYYTYVRVEDGARIDDIQSQSRAFFDRHLADGAGTINAFTAVPLTDIHLGPARGFDISTPGSLATVYTFSAIAAFILLIACINFMNLATARAAQRAKEVGVRKVIGAQRRQIIAQFLGESLLLTFLAVALAVACVELLLPVYGNFLQKEFEFDYIGNPTVLAALGALTLVVGLLAGSYPAFYLSAFQPAHVLKGDVTRGKAAATFRSVLVTLQFSISIALVIATAVVYQQMRFARNIELGYNKDQVVIVSGSLSEGLGGQWEILKRRWLAHPEITGATASFQVPGDRIGSFFRIRAEGGDPEGLLLPFSLVDYGFFETYDIDVLAGRTFSEDFGTDRVVDASEETLRTTGTYVLSELAARQLGWTPEEALGKQVEVQRAPQFARSIRGPVIGVVQDARFESVHYPIQPMLYMVPDEDMLPGDRAALSEASLRITGRNIEATLAYIDATWVELVPDQPVTRHFLDDDFEALYRSEARQGQLLAAFSLLAILIACLGLFGMASFTTQRRTKEIGVRKIMGGSVWDIIRLFTAEFSRLVLLANIVAWPIAYFLMQRWLASFAYRIDMSPLVFAGSALVAFAVAWLTVGAVAARAAGSKPIHALRYE